MVTNLTIDLDQCRITSLMCIIYSFLQMYHTMVSQNSEPTSVSQSCPLVKITEQLTQLILYKHILYKHIYSAE